MPKTAAPEKPRSSASHPPPRKPALRPVLPSCPPRLPAGSARRGNVRRRTRRRANRSHQGGASNTKIFVVHGGTSDALGNRRRELHLFFPTESRALAEMLQARDPMERLRTVLNQVVGQPLRVCVKLDANAGASWSVAGSELRARFEQDPIVRAMLREIRRTNLESEASGRGINHGSQSTAADALAVPAGAGKTRKADRRNRRWKPPPAAAWSP